MRWFRQLTSSVAVDRSDSGVTRGGIRSKKPKPTTTGVGGSQAEKFNVASNSMYLGLWSVGGM